MHKEQSNDTKKCGLKRTIGRPLAARSIFNRHEIVLSPSPSGKLVGIFNHRQYAREEVTLLLIQRIVT